MADVDQLYKRAEDAFAKRNYDYAKDLFLQILLLNPNHAQSRKALRATILKKFTEGGGAPGKIKLAILFGKVKVELATAKNNVQKRIDVSMRYLLDDPNHSSIRTILAEALEELGHIEGASTEAELALESDPKNVSAAKILVNGFKKMGKIQEAQDILTRIQKYAEDDRELERLQRELSAIATTNLGFTDAATTRDGYRGVLKDSGQAELLERRQHMIKSEDDAKEYIRDLQAEFDKAPDYKIARRIGDTYLDFLKNVKSAEEWFKKAIELNSHDSVLKDRLEDCTIRSFDQQILQADKAKDPRVGEFKANRLRFVINTYERRVKDRPTDMGLRFELGKAYYTAGPNFLDKAIAEFQQSVKDPKKKIESHYHLALGFHKKRLFDMADSQYERALEGGVMGQEKKLMIMYNRALCNRDSKNLARAMEIGKQIMDIDINYKDIASLVEEWKKQVENGGGSA